MIKLKINLIIFLTFYIINPIKIDHKKALWRKYKKFSKKIKKN